MSKRHLLLLLPLLAACQPPQPVTSQGRPLADETTVQRAPDAVAGSIEQVLAGFSAGMAPVAVSREGEAIVLETDITQAAMDEAAVCPRITIYDPWAEDRSQRFRWTNADSWTGTAKVVVRPAAEGSSVRVETRYLGSYLNSYTGWPEERMCRSTGEAENRLLEAARAGS